MKSTVADVMEKYSSLPPFCPLYTKKPVTQAQMLDMIGFLKDDYLTASLRALPALNAGTLLAGISISLPV